MNIDAVVSIHMSSAHTILLFTVRQILNAIKKDTAKLRLQNMATYMTSSGIHVTDSKFFEKYTAKAYSIYTDTDLVGFGFALFYAMAASLM